MQTLSEQPLSLRARLSGMMGLVFLGGLGGLYFAAAAYARHAADRSYDRLLIGSAQSIAESLSVRPEHIEVDVPYSALDMLSAAPDDRVFYRVIGPDGATITGSSDLPGVMQNRVADEDRGDSRVRLFDARHRGEDARFAMVGREVSHAGQKGLVWVEVGQTRLARDALAGELLIQLLLPIMAMAALALICIWLVVGRALRPLERLGRDLTAREPSDLTPIVMPVASEIQPLLAAINLYTKRLAGNVAFLRSFIADAAHQMRTPLAALLSQAQAAASANPGDVRSSLETIERSAFKLTRLLNQLLSDATVAHRADLGTDDVFDLVVTVQQAIRDSVLLSDDSDIRFTTPLQEAPMRGDGVILAEAIKNLLHNAMVHGRGAAGEILIELERVGDTYDLRVSDRGPGIDAALGKRAFDRFSRGSSQTRGAGLGLAIVKQAIERHRGTITLQDRAGGGLTALVMLPVS